MIKAILVDDEVHCLETLSILLEEHCPEVQVLDQYTSAKAALKGIEVLSPDLVFLDIEMPSMNGFELLEHYREIPFAVIFTTSYDQYAIKAIHFSALEYLLKPIGPKDLVAAVQKLQAQKNRPSQEQFQLLFGQVLHRGGDFAKMAVPTLEGFELVDIGEIVRCEAADNYTHIHLKNKSKVIACRSLKEIEVQLKDFPAFLRIHHSHLVNLNQVTRYVRGEGGYVVMMDGNVVNVSRSRKEVLLKKFF